VDSTDKVNVEEAQKRKEADSKLVSEIIPGGGEQEEAAGVGPAEVEGG